MKIQPTLSEVQPASTSSSAQVDGNTDTNPETGDFFAMLAGLFLPQMLQKPLPEAAKTQEGAQTVDSSNLPNAQGDPNALELNLSPINWSIPLPVAAQQDMQMSNQPTANLAVDAQSAKLNLPPQPAKTTNKEKITDTLDTPSYTDFDVSNLEDEPSTFADALADAAPIVLPQVAMEAKPEVKIPDNISTSLQDISQVLNQAAPTVHLSEPSNRLILNTKEELVTPSVNDRVQIEFSPVNLTAIGKELYSAQIKIHPPELGNILAKLKMDKDGANLTILAENNVVKGILEANLPALKEHFQRADIPLNQIQVAIDPKLNPQLFADQNREQRPQNQSNQYQSGQEEVENTNIVYNETKKDLDSLIDTYA